MRNEGPLILVEDDHDDQQFMLSTLKELGLENEVKVFRHGAEALAYLCQATEQPFLILSDINMPVMDGITLKKKIEADDLLRKKCIPFVFLSTNPTPFIKQICDMSIQGFFEKGNSVTELTRTLGTILQYWHLTKHVN